MRLVIIPHQAADIPGDTGRRSRTANDFIGHGNGNNALAARSPLRRMSGNVGPIPLLIVAATVRAGVILHIRWPDLQRKPVTLRGIECDNFRTVYYKS